MNNFKLGLALLAAVALPACTHTVADPSGDASNAAVIRTIGDTGVRLNRSPQNYQPTAYIMNVDGKELSGAYYEKLTLPSGARQLRIKCNLPSSAVTGTPRPFERYEDGVGGIFGAAEGYATAIIQLRVDLERGRTYDLTCAPVGNMKARAEIKPAGP